MARQPRVFHLLQRAHSALFRAADRRLKREADISVSQQGVLFVLARQDGVPITEIADVLNMGYSSLTGLVDRMSERGLVRRETNVEDGRVQNVFIEERGRDVLARTLAEVKRINGALLDPFTTSEQQVIERFLTHVAKNAADITFEKKAAARRTERKVS